MTSAFRKPFAYLLLGFFLAVVLPASAVHAQRFAIVPNAGGTVTDGTFNQFAYEGALRAASAVGGTVLVRESTSDAEYVPIIEELVASDVDCIVTVGFLLADVTAQQSALFPEQLFAIVDVSYNPELQNVAGVVFREDQAGYLTGVIAGLVSESKVVACIGGPEFIPPIPKYCNGFREGVKSTCKECSFLVEYVNDFFDDALGQSVAQRFMALGADVIQSAAGPTGSAAVLTFTRAGLWGFGVDQDEWVSTYGSGSEASSRFLLGSAVKRVDVAVESILLEVAADAFLPGTRLFDAAINGIGVAPCHDSCEFYTEEVVTREADAFARLQDGVTATGIDGGNGALTFYTRPSDDQWFEMLAIGLRPSARSGHSFTGFPDGVALLFGGTTSGNLITNSLYAYDYAAQTWTLLTPSGAPTPRTRHTAVAVGERYLAVFGGDLSGDATLTDELWVYDRAENAWQSRSSAGGPAARQQHAAAYLDGRMYVYGGQLSNFAVTGDLWAIDVDASSGSVSSWQQIRPELDGAVIEARRQHSAAAAAGRIFFFGGELASTEISDELIIYDPADQTMVVFEKGSSPAPLERRDASLASNENGLYLFGGIGVAAGQLFNDVWEFNAVQLSWQQRVPATAVEPTGRGLHSATLAYDHNLNRTRLLVYGGQDLVERSRQVWQFSIPDLVITYQEYIDCGARETFLAPAGSLPSFDFSAGIFAIEYQCDGNVDCDNVYDEGFNCSPSTSGVYVAFAVLAFCGVLMLIGFAVHLILHWSHPVYVHASRWFVLLSLFGSLLGYGCIFTFFGQPTDAQCIVQIWFLPLSFTVMLAPLLAKTFRVVYIMRKVKTFRLAKITNVELLGWVCGLLLINIIICSIWTGVSTPQAQLSLESEKELLPKYHLKCNSDHNEVFIWLSLGYAIAMLVAGLILAFLARNVSSAFNESKWISFAIYNFCFIGAVIIPIMILLDNDQAARLILQSIAIFVAVTGFVLLLCVPKIMAVWNNETASGFFTSATRVRATTTGTTTSATPRNQPSKLETTEDSENPLDKVVSAIFDGDEA
eukprot:CAMPEP_0177664442 /NCGR_PEP_ID=MMETSP0447-20121125/20496_1 /TAXON_ID=0 /ORGANISM="Stygamoeba regulata, Strain BSH-02190019" /LENGTH=1047 /DNA_ID=CAMNT_0019170415 /DNA_START=50 /DNA_END=3193 /DNA_ORIENTATION=+